MTVYKGYMRIAKRNAGMFFLYLAIFFVITLMFQSMGGEAEVSGYQAEKLRLAVLDADGGSFAKAFEEYLGRLHDVTETEDDAETLQEKLFYRDVEYIVRIPENFYETCIKEGTKLAVTKVPGSYTAYYADQQINSFLNNARVYAAAGFTEEETAEVMKMAPKVSAELLDIGAGTGETPMYVMYFRYMAYLFLGVLGYVVGSMVSAMRKGALKKRMQASAVPHRKQSLEGLLACLTVSVILWIIVIGAGFLFYGKELLETPKFPYQILNSAALLCVSVSVSYLIGSLSKGTDDLNGMVNVVSLGFCFLGGAFVPLEVMSSGVKKAAQFLPVYWYETANELLGGFPIENVREEVLKSVGIQLVFAVVFVCITLVVAKRRQTV